MKDVVHCGYAAADPLIAAPRSEQKPTVLRLITACVISAKILPVEKTSRTPSRGDSRSTEGSSAGLDVLKRF